MQAVLVSFSMHSANVDDDYDKLDAIVSLMTKT